jgi:hypothetical protein
MEKRILRRNALYHPDTAPQLEQSVAPMIVGRTTVMRRAVKFQNCHNALVNDEEIGFASLTLPIRPSDPTGTLGEEQDFGCI